MSSVAFAVLNRLSATSFKRTVIIIAVYFFLSRGIGYMQTFSVFMLLIISQIAKNKIYNKRLFSQLIPDDFPAQ